MPGKCVDTLPQDRNFVTLGRVFGFPHHFFFEVLTLLILLGEHFIYGEVIISLQFFFLH